MWINLAPAHPEQLDSAGRNKKKPPPGLVGVNKTHTRLSFIFGNPLNLFVYYVEEVSHKHILYRILYHGLGAYQPHIEVVKEVEGYQHKPLVMVSIHPKKQSVTLVVLFEDSGLRNPPGAVAEEVAFHEELGGLYGVE